MTPIIALGVLFIGTTPNDLHNEDKIEEEHDCKYKDKPFVYHAASVGNVEGLKNVHLLDTDKNGAEY